MISTLYKYPWFANEHVSLKERDMIFDITCNLLRTLMRQLRTAHHRRNEIVPQLTVELLQEFLRAALTVPFSQRQKAVVVDVINEHEHGVLVSSVGYQGLGSLTQAWPFEALDKKPGVQLEVVDVR